MSTFWSNHTNNLLWPKIASWNCASALKTQLGALRPSASLAWTAQGRLAQSIGGASSWLPAGRGGGASWVGAVGVGEVGQPALGSGARCLGMTASTSNLHQLEVVSGDGMQPLTKIPRIRISASDDYVLSMI